jgi:hypothetical protein
MSKIDRDHIRAQLHELHGYELNTAGADRCAAMLAGVAAAVAALTPESQFYEEPANLAVTLAALAPDSE